MMAQSKCPHCEQSIEYEIGSTGDAPCPHCGEQIQFVFGIPKPKWGSARQSTPDPKPQPKPESTRQEAEPNLQPSRKTKLAELRKQTCYPVSRGVITALYTIACIVCIGGVVFGLSRAPNTEGVLLVVGYLCGLIAATALREIMQLGFDISDAVIDLTLKDGK